MKTTRRIGFLALVCFVLSPQTGAIEKNDSPFDQSYRLSQTLGGREQLFYLVELCRISPQLNLADAKAKEYSLRLFNLPSTDQGIDIDLRVLAQKNAVSCLSYADPAEAMKLLAKVKFQRPRTGQWVYQDPRYNAAEKTFINFLTKTKQHPISEIVTKARYLGQTGQYPYFAVARVINGLPLSSKSAANTLLNDALDFYTNETGFYNRDQEFLLLLQSLRNTKIDRALAARAVATFVQRLKNDPIHLPGDYYAEVHIASTGKVFPFTNRNEAFLFQAFPQIRRFNPRLAAQLLQEDPKLGQAADAMSYISAGFVDSDPTSERATRQHLQWLQESLVRRIKDCQSSNPQATAALAQRLTDPSSRIIGFSAAIPGIARTNRSQASELYEKQLSDLTNLRDSIERLRALVALVPVARYLGDSKHYESLSEEAFSTGLRFFNSDGKTMSVQSRKGFAEIHALVRVTASQGVNTLEPKIQQIPNDSWLKAYLLLYEAEGQANPTVSKTPAKSCSQ